MQQLRRLAARYERVNAAHPIKVRGGVGIGLFFIGDVLAQRIGHEPATVPAGKAGLRLDAAVNTEQSRRLQSYPQREGATERVIVLPSEPLPARLVESSEPVSWSYQDWDAQRTLRSCSWRAIIWAPSAHYFWLFLEAYISPRVAHFGHVGTALKIAFDFCTIGPPLIFSFLYWSKLWESRFDHAVTLRHTLDRYPSTLLASYTFWAPLHFATYGLVPLRHRMVWVSACSVAFGALLSHFNAR